MSLPTNLASTSLPQSVHGFWHLSPDLSCKCPGPTLTPGSAGSSQDDEMRKKNPAFFLQESSLVSAAADGNKSHLLIYRSISRNAKKRPLIQSTSKQAALKSARELDTHTHTAAHTTNLLANEQDNKIWEHRDFSIMKHQHQHTVCVIICTPPKDLLASGCRKRKLQLLPVMCL